ncbi:MAG: alpha/beta fold hydrolase [Deltaproteobacteria bacterium]|nr:alpha/beta fold hydrolase [Deltaproteobacteria bacterium]MCW5800851.1 alpha/beta fold hydrolase [Deltaproteobacteria bacterium]
MSAPPLVVLLHGLARRRGSMARLERFLRARGHDVASHTYPSRRHSISYLARDVADWVAERAAGREVSAVTHSMGGVIARHLHDPRIAWHRIVMLAPPNRGSLLAASAAHSAVFRWFYGPAGAELADGSAWPAPPAPFGIIAGTRARALTNPSSWTLGRRFPEGTAHDGTVAVEETRLDGMAAFAEVDATHTWIMNDARVHALVERFLADGRFG